MLLSLTMRGIHFILCLIAFIFLLFHNWSLVHVYYISCRKFLFCFIFLRQLPFFVIYTKPQMFFCLQFQIVWNYIHNDITKHENDKKYDCDSAKFATIFYIYVRNLYFLDSSINPILLFDVHDGIKGRI